mmetsp:Transcript_56535/g.137237  ORF Transcript_56535/g.137237 Transcript_56535/m.137237 type:complete len:455 (-) Transcript_56535:138-1502(-)
MMSAAGNITGNNDTTTIATASQRLDGFQWRIFPPLPPPSRDHKHPRLRPNRNQPQSSCKKRKCHKSTSPSSSSHPFHHIPNKTIVFVKETNDFRRLACQVNSASASASSSTSPPTVSTLTRQNDEEQDNDDYGGGGDGGGDGDHVLEVGCSSGGLSKLILQRRPLSWVGIDNSQEMIDRCQNYLKDVFVNNVKDTTRTKLVKIDVISEPTRAYEEIVNVATATTTTESSTASSSTTTFPSSSPTVIFVDIGGNRDDISVLKVLEWIFLSFLSGNRTDNESGQDTTPSSSTSSSLPLRLVVVKSRALVESIQSSSLSDGEIEVSSTGVVSDGATWFHEAVTERVHNVRPPLPKHPLKAPMVFSPVGDGTTPICRYHNYHVKGCWKYNSVINRRRNNNNNNDDDDYDEDPATTRPKESTSDGKDAVNHVCPFDHDHCHACLQRGHKARDCSLFCST